MAAGGEGDGLFGEGALFAFAGGNGAGGRGRTGEAHAPVDALAGGGGRAADEPLSVSAAMALAKGSLESVRVRLVGEVSELSAKRGYKAVYFTVKDEKAALPCMMWNNRYAHCGVQLAVGQLVELNGRFTLYAAKGRMNFDVFSVALAGEGDLRMRVAALERKLAAEGLMDDARKRPLPAYPEAVGLVTSPRGAAVHDVLRTLRRRYPLAAVKFAGVPVEGKGAPEGIIAGIQSVVEAGAEVVLVVRGGGSYEDLMPFNDEGLARAIAACPVPVVTGIGHEPDTGIADKVADLRASTPTAAAEAVAPQVADIRAGLVAKADAMASRLTRRLASSEQYLRSFAAHPLFTDPMYLLSAEAQEIDLAASRLPRAVPDALGRDAAALEALRHRLGRTLPEAPARRRRELDELRSGLARAARADMAGRAAAVQAGRTRLRALGPALCGPARERMGVGAAKLEGLSPLAVLGRGYSITRDEGGAVVKSVEAVKAGSSVDVSVSDGWLHCTVKGVRKELRGIEDLEDEPCRS